MQTIIGASGSIGLELAKELPKYTDKIRLVSRNPKKVNPSDELFPADVNDANQIDKAVEGSDVVYVTLGFDYNIKVWREKWPPFIENIIKACSRHNAKLVFFDNVYMYDPTEIPHMTEDSKINPSSKKGKVRAQIAKMIMDAAESGKIKAIIARSADFIAPKNSVIIELVYNNLKKGKKANWFVSTDKKHNFTTAPDAGKGTAILGNTDDAYNQVWHLPSARPALTGKQWVELFAKELNAKPGVMTIPAWMLRIIGVFMPIMKEFVEMLYQYKNDYFFDSSKFETKFGYTPMTPEESVKYIVKELS